MSQRVPKRKWVEIRRPVKRLTVQGDDDRLCVVVDDFPAWWHPIRLYWLWLELRGITVVGEIEAPKH